MTGRNGPLLPPVLAEALAAAFEKWDWTVDGETWDAMADKIAAEYARLIAEPRPGNVDAMWAALELADRVASSFVRRESGHVTEGKVQEYQRFRGEMAARLIAEPRP